MRRIALIACLAAAPAWADVDRAVNEAVLPAFVVFSDQTTAIAEAARSDCTAEALRPAFQKTFDAWIGISPYQFGPLQRDGRNLAIGFWPDTRGMVADTIAGLIAEKDPAVDSEATFAEVSVAGRGLFALEYLLYDEKFDGYGAADYSCRLAIALAADLARMGREMTAEWPDHGALLTGAGTPGNSAYLSGREAAQELYTALMTGLEFTKDQRIGRPMGTFDRPRPARAEAWRSGRSLRNVILSLETLRHLADTLAAGPIPMTDGAFEAALEAANGLDDPILAGVENPAGRLKLEILQQKIARIQEVAATELGAALGVAQGFNSTDGD